MALRRGAALVALAGIASACTCEAPGPSFAPSEPAPVERAPSEPARAPAEGAMLAQALGELPAATPMVTVSVHDGSFDVANGALRDALARARDIESARAARSGGGAPLGIALRVDAGARWQRVLQALFAAGMTGWAEPRFVLRAARGGGEVALGVPLPSIDRIEPGAVLTIRIGADRAITAQLGGEPLAPTCERVESGRQATLAAQDGAIDVAGLGRCLDAARATESLQVARTSLVAEPSLPFAELAPALEIARARGDVVIAVGR